MGPHFLTRLFEPKSIAVFGASEREGAVGTRVFRNLIKAGYQGKLFPVNPKHPSVQGHPAFAKVRDIGLPVDLAVIATPAQATIDVIRQCGEADVRAAVVLSAGFRETGEAGVRLERQLKETAAHYNLRLIGPNCLGMMRPRVGIDATFLDTPAEPGRLALVSQSGAVCTAILDWAGPRNIGFSTIVSLGNAADLDFGDILDYLAMDPQTDAILGMQLQRMGSLRPQSHLAPAMVLRLLVGPAVAVLAAIAVPSYRQYVLRSHRAEAKTALLNVAAAQERFYLQNNTYTTDLTSAPTATPPGLGQDRVQQRQHPPDVVPRGQFRHHPAEGHVHVDLRVQGVGQQAGLAVEQGEPGLVAGGLDAQDQHPASLRERPGAIPGGICGLNP